MVSISKGLGCPVDRVSIQEVDAGAAWEIRKRLGGGMRQSGILRPRIVRVDHHLSRHRRRSRNAKRFAALLPTVRPSDRPTRDEHRHGRPAA